MSKGIVILTPFYSPNIGGVETHFDDLVEALDNNSFRVYVQTYSPITTKGVNWKSREKKGNNISIRRYWWFGKNLFHKIEKYPFLDFLYIAPYLFVRVFIFMIVHHKKIDVVHAQGFNATLISLVLKKFFSFKLIASTHAIYELDRKSKTAILIKYILEKCDKVLCLSQASKNELIEFGVSSVKLDSYRYWIDLDYFKPMDQLKIREKYSIDNKFTVLFVGRLIEKKGINLLISVAKDLKNIQFVFIGVGPLDLKLIREAEDNTNIIFLGKKANKDLVEFYNLADLFCIPSQYEEGFGRVVIEAVACGIPVVGSNKGGIKEALNQDTSILVNPTANNIKESIQTLYNDKSKLLKLKKNCIEYSRKSFSPDNLSQITKYY
jgi:glycosyltransferase involved in cell wall biosynthesis